MTKCVRRSARRRGEGLRFLPITCETTLFTLWLSGLSRFHSSCEALIAPRKAMTSDGKTSMKWPSLPGPAPPSGDMPLWSIRRKEDSLHGIAFCISYEKPSPPPEQAAPLPFLLNPISVCQAVGMLFARARCEQAPGNDLAKARVVK